MMTCGGVCRVGWRKAVEEQEAGWQAVPRLQARARNCPGRVKEKWGGEKKPKSCYRRGKARTWRIAGKDD